MTEIIRQNTPIDYTDDYWIMDSTSYAALTVKHKCIIYGTSAAPTPTGYPDGCIYLQHEA